MNARCSYCDNTIQVPSDAVEGELVKCVDCGTLYEVKIGSEGSVTLTEAEEVEEDWGE